MKINLNSKLTLMIRGLIYSLGGIVSRFFLLKPQLIVLCYHGISTDGWRFSTPPEEFKKHIGYLMQNFGFASLDDLNTILNSKKRPNKPQIVITFDDGYQDLLSLVPYFKDLGIRPAVFVLSNPESANVLEMDNHKQLLTQSDLKYLSKSGWIIGCHSATHPNFFSLSDLQLKDEILRSKKTLESLVGKPIKYFAYPKGRYTPKIKEFVRDSGYKLAFSMDNAIISPNSTDLFSIPRIGIDSSHNTSEFQNTLAAVNINIRRIIGRFVSHYEIS